jgi:uncharacterized membrane protein (UPF0127 family)
MTGRVVARVLIVWLLFGAVLGLVLALAGPDDEAISASDGDIVRVSVGGVPVFAEIARTDRSRTRGLAGHRRPQPGEGMLFVFGSTVRRDFWMRGVPYSLDMIWIRGDRVTGVTARAPREAVSGERLYPSPGPVDRVLEVAGGWAAARSVEAGDRYRGP